MAQDLDVDRFCPTPSDDPYWNESCWFSFSIPERGIHGGLYHYFRPNMKVLMGGPMLWDASGAHPWDCLFYDWHHIQPIPAKAEKFDFTSHTSLTVTVVEPCKQYRLGYDNNGFHLALDWTAIAEPHHFLGMEIESTGASPENRMHLEQMGRATGQAQLRGETLEIDSFALRDTSWGVRNLDSVTRGSYLWAIASEETAFHAQTRGEGDEQEVVGGFLMLDGKISTLSGGTRTVTEMGLFTPDLFRLEIADQLGRSADITAKVSSNLMFNGLPRSQVVWSLLEADFGSGVKGWGDIQEWQPMEQFRRMVRGS